MECSIDEHARVLENRCVYGRLFESVFEAPQLAASLAPGQFVHMSIPGMPDHVLRRPLSVYSWDAAAGTIDILYQVVGHGTRQLAGLERGASVQMLGPIGIGWAAALKGDLPERALLVGGGVGAAPLFEWCKALMSKGCEVDVILGAQTKEALVAHDRYADVLGREPFCSTDDGSYGYAGFATGLIEQRLEHGASISGAPYDYVAVCGPAPLMRAAADRALTCDIACYVSLERRMACGIGACLSCVCDTNTQGRKRVCVDGPVFDAREVVW